MKTFAAFKVANHSLDELKMMRPRQKPTYQADANHHLLRAFLTQGRAKSAVRCIPHTTILFSPRLEHSVLCLRRFDLQNNLNQINAVSPFKASHMFQEVLARQEIDRLLAQCGWLAENCRDMNITAGPGVANREISLVTGEADYLLFVDSKVTCLIEAKPPGISLATAETQSRTSQPVLHARYGLQIVELEYVRHH